MESIKKTFKIFAVMVVFTLCVVGYFGDNMPLMIVGALSGYWILASLFANRKSDREIDIIE